ncbi:hypothetical protein HHK36_013046 [Tetracentron sinense]|uniref:Uncharacterized protein n=1 Tax=Tetracentron sinense TaxID=13715 RepID=A0A835DJA4_TETSI|nr:hypothetical protein HHK36_013046 [Tetracentron sinense]
MIVGPKDSKCFKCGDKGHYALQCPTQSLHYCEEEEDEAIQAWLEDGDSFKDEATPKTILRTMGVKGLTLYHLKSHLQKYRLGKQSGKEFTDNTKDGSCIAENQGTGSSSSSSSSRIMAQDLNDGYQVTEALRVQMEVQRRLHEQLEVQRHLHIRIEAQGKYLQSILEKACKALNDHQAVALAGLEDAAREELSELAIQVSKDSLSAVQLSEISAAREEKSASNGPAWIGDCSVDSCLTSTGSPVSPMGVGSSQATTMKRRLRPMFGHGESQPWESDIQPDMEWMMTDEDSNGTVDYEELKKCLQNLQLHLTEKEMEDLFHSCDMNENEGIQFNEFIVLLCLIYLLMEPSATPHNGSTRTLNTLRIGSPQLEATFDTIIEAFLFLDKNGDGKLNKKEIIKALNEASPWEKSPRHITKPRFSISGTSLVKLEQMDWDKSGKVSFKEFLFTLTNWIGFDTDDEKENSCD